MKKIKFALVGCGRIAPRHAESLQKVTGAELVAAADIISDKADAFCDKYKAKSFHSIDALIQWGQFDVVNICTPSGLHAEHAIQFLKAKKNVVVEKPMALKLQDAEAMISEAEKNGVQLFVVKQNRYNLPVQALRKALDEGRFGKLVLGTIRVRWCRNQSYYDQASWRGTWALDGGVFSNQASHHIDLLEWFMGEADSVFAKTSTQLVNIECEDTGAAVIKFKNGSIGIIEATTATRPLDLEGSLSVLGESGSAEISGFAVNQIRHFNFVNRLPEDAEMLSRFSQTPPNVYGFGHQAYLQNVVDALNGKAKASVDGREGKKSLELIHALYVSSETGKEVFLNEITSYKKESRLGKK